MFREHFFKIHFSISKDKLTLCTRLFPLRRHRKSSISLCCPLWGHKMFFLANTTKKIIPTFWGLEISVIISFVLYRISEEGKQQKQMTHHKFVKSLVNQLKGDFREFRSRPFTLLSDNRLNNNLHIPNVWERKRNCIVFLAEKHQAEGTNNILLWNVYKSTRYPCWELL